MQKQKQIPIQRQYSVVFSPTDKGWQRILLDDNTYELQREVVLVYNGIDRYDTIIEPRGMNTNPTTVTNDYNHNNVNTGAYFTDLEVKKDIEVQGIGDEKVMLDEALTAIYHIPEFAELRYKVRGVNEQGISYYTGAVASNGSLYEMAERDEIKAVSVGFRPVSVKNHITGEIEAGERLDKNTGITTYLHWDLINVSVLDTTPGQPFSGFVRKLNIENNIMENKEEVKKEVETTETVETTKVVETTEEVKTESTEPAKTEPAETEPAKTEEAKPVETTEPVETDKEDNVERAYVGQTVQNKAGVFGVVSAIDSSITDKVEVVKTTVTKLNGESIITDEITYGSDGDWKSIDSGLLILELIKNKPAERSLENEGGVNEEKELKDETSLKDENEKLQATNKELARKLEIMSNSPNAENIGKDTGSLDGSSDEAGVNSENRSYAEMAEINRLRK